MGPAGESVTISNGTSTLQTRQQLRRYHQQQQSQSSNATAAWRALERCTAGTHHLEPEAAADARPTLLTQVAGVVPAMADDGATVLPNVDFHHRESCGTVLLQQALAAARFQDQRVRPPGARRGGHTFVVAVTGLQRGQKRFGCVGCSCGGRCWRRHFRHNTTTDNTGAWRCLGCVMITTPSLPEQSPCASHPHALQQEGGHCGTDRVG
jgi:hypothetical protein